MTMESIQKTYYNNIIQYNTIKHDVQYGNKTQDIVSEHYL